MISKQKMAAPPHRPSKSANASAAAMTAALAMMMLLDSVGWRSTPVIVGAGQCSARAARSRPLLGGDGGGKSAVDAVRIQEHDGGQHEKAKHAVQQGR